MPSWDDGYGIELVLNEENLIKNCRKKLQKLKTYRTGELAKMAGIHQSTVWHHIKNGKLKTLNGIGDVWHRVSHEEAMRWLESRKK